MDELIIKSLRGTASEAEESTLSRWRSESPQNELEFQGVAAVWRLSARTRVPMRKARPEAADILRYRRPQRSTPRTRTLNRVAAIAASVVLGFLIARSTPLVGPGPVDTAETSVITGVGELATATLEDGTVVRLAPESRLRISVQADVREVWLEGRAFFAVASDSTRPFRVRTSAGDARVLGTRFDMSARGSELRLLVVEGSVEVGDEGESVRLTARQMGHLTRGSPAQVVEVGDLEPFLGWLGSFLVFESTPLGEVARDIEVRYSVDVQIADETIADRTVTAWFTDQPVDSVVAVICRIVEAHCSIEGSSVRITDRSEISADVALPQAPIQGGSR